MVGMFPLPKIIQGGMGVGVSNWRLAQAVSRLGQLGVVSGPRLTRCWCAGWPMATRAATCAGASMHFRFRRWRSASGTSYFVPGGKAAAIPYPTTPMHQRADSRKLIELLMVSNFVEVFLARQGHLNKVGVNFLEKVQLPHLASIYGAMLAGVGYVLMGAGIPLHIPGVLDNLCSGKPAEYRLAVTRRAGRSGHDDAV